MSSSSHHNAPPRLDLLALSDLSPPSPILSPAELATDWSWSDIQMELDCTIDEASLDSLHGDNIGLGIFPSSSGNSVATAGTFGPNCKRHKILKRHSPVLRNPMVEICLSSLEDDSCESSCSHFPMDISFSTIASSKNALDRDPGLTTSTLSATLSLDATHGMARSQTLTPSDDLSTFSDISSAPAGLQDSHINDSNFILLPAESPPFHGSYFLPPSDSRSMSLQSKVQSAVLSTIEFNAPVDIISRQRVVAATLATLEKKCHSEPSSPICTLASSSYGPLANPSAATVEILIDQEGFRGVLATFKYTGCTPACPVGGDNWGVAQFKPIQRQTFNFHYSSLEPLPVLRRISVNGEEARDHTTRQASLCLRTNGVYFIRGSETLSFSPRGETTSGTKLQWKFEYMVDDRRNNASGKIISDGEKTLTPLSFSCSPLLLHPLQGKRVRLMHIMKKSVIPKLVAEKMEPPSLSPKPEPELYLTTKKTLPFLLEASTSTWRSGCNLHKRCATIWIAQAEVLPVVPLSGGTVREQKPVLHRRRASSAGERTWPGSLLSPLSLHGTGPSCHNIIPPSRLAALIDAEVSSEESSHPPLTLLDTSFYPLSPIPRYPYTSTTSKI